MLKSYKYRIYPDKLQQALIGKHFQACRFIYNLSLETKIAAYKSTGATLSAFDLNKQLTDLKKDCVWLSEVYNHSLQAAIKNMDTAFKRFYDGSGFPKFKSKKDCRKSYTVPDYIKMDFEKHLLTLPKITPIKIIIDRCFTGTIKQAIISQTPTGKYFASIVVDDKQEYPSLPPVQESTAIGVDLGIKSLAVTSSGCKIDNPLYLKKSLAKLKYLQRQFSKKKRSSKSAKKLKQKIAKRYEKISNQRADYLHKVSTQLISDNQTICLETLAVKNMLKNHSLSQKITDSSFSEFVRMLEYKSKWYGRNIIRIGRFEPTSKTCSVCGKVNHNLTLKDRIFVCECGSLDRDINAAINIKRIALQDHLGSVRACKAGGVACNSRSEEAGKKQRRNIPKTAQLLKVAL